MTYSQNDVIGFPPPVPPPRVFTLADLVEELDPAVRYPVVYSFGGAAPDYIILRDGTELHTSNSYGGVRLFVEYLPYAWNPQSPDWGG